MKGAPFPGPRRAGGWALKVLRAEHHGEPEAEPALPAEAEAAARGAVTPMSSRSSSRRSPGDGILCFTDRAARRPRPRRHAGVLADARGSPRAVGIAARAADGLAGRARRRCRPPGREAGEHLPGARGRRARGGEAARLRLRLDARRRSPRRRPHGPRDTRVHRARAGPGHAGSPVGRRLLARRSCSTRCWPGARPSPAATPPSRASTPSCPCRQSVGFNPAAALSPELEAVYRSRPRQEPGKAIRLNRRPRRPSWAPRRRRGGGGL